MQAVRVSRNTPTTFRSVRFACTDAGQSMRQNLEGSKQFRRPLKVGIDLPSPQKGAAGSGFGRDIAVLAQFLFMPLLICLDAC